MMLLYSYKFLSFVFLLLYFNSVVSYIARECCFTQRSEKVEILYEVFTRTLYNLKKSKIINILVFLRNSFFYEVINLCALS